MEIKELTITEKELAEAVEHFLLRRFDVRLKVNNVSKQYSYHNFYTVEADLVDNGDANESGTPPTAMADRVETDQTLQP